MRFDERTRGTWNDPGRASFGPSGDPQPFSPVGDPASEVDERNASGWLRPAELPQLRVVLLGPSGSGKSSFAAALEQVSTVSPAGVIRRSVPFDTQAAGHDAPARDDSHTSRDHGLEIELARPRVAVELLVHDEAADSILPVGKHFSPFWIDRARTSQLIVLCVDGVRPRPGYWRRATSLVVAELSRPTVHDEDLALGARAVLPHLRHHPEGTRCLPFSRILFLISHVDALCLDLMRVVNAGQGQLSFLRRSTTGGVPGLALARSLDPAPQLLSLLGAFAVGRLLHAAHSDAQVAVGAVSARGALDAASAEDEECLLAGEHVDPWLSFGVRECLEFMLTGACRGAVAPLGLADLAPYRSVRVL